MNKAEVREANTLHAIWDIIVMHHSIESAMRTYEITVSDIELIIAKLKEKCNEHRINGDLREATRLLSEMRKATEER